MSYSHRFLIAVCFAGLLPFSGICAEAPVVDDSENFALMDEQQAAYERPVTRRGSAQLSDRDEEIAFAHDNAEATSNPAASSGNNNPSVLLDKIQGLQQDVQELRGQLEVQTHELKLLKEQQLAFYKDLDARINHEPLKTAKDEQAALDPKQAANPNGPAFDKSQDKSAINANVMPTRAHPNPADAQISYLAAYELIKTKRYDEALVAMQSFVTQNPQSGYTANAQYWLGELFMVKKQYPEAINHFGIVLQQYPTSSKSSASLLKLGYALAASGKKEEAIQRLQQVVKAYPNTNTAQLAKVKLETLGS